MTSYYIAIRREKNRQVDCLSISTWNALAEICWFLGADSGSRNLQNSRWDFSKHHRGKSCQTQSRVCDEGMVDMDYRKRHCAENEAGDTKKLCYVAFEVLPRPGIEPGPREGSVRC